MKLGHGMNNKKTTGLGLALVPISVMLLLLVIGHGVMELRIEPLLLLSAAAAALQARWQGYGWDEILGSMTDKLAKAMPVILILICVGAIIGTPCSAAPSLTWCTGD